MQEVFGKLYEVERLNKIHVRITGYYRGDTSQPDFMDNLKGKIELMLEKQRVFHKANVREIIIGKPILLRKDGCLQP